MIRNWTLPMRPQVLLEPHVAEHIGNGPHHSRLRGVLARPRPVRPRQHTRIKYLDSYAQIETTDILFIAVPRTVL